MLRKPHQKPIYSLEEGNQPQFHDKMFNFVIGASFEIGISLTILDEPNLALELLQPYCERLATIIEKIYDTQLGQITISTNNATLKELFDQSILKALHPRSDQLGRCLDQTLTESWYQGLGQTWTIQQLNQTEHSYNRLLTKIRTLDGYGEILRMLSPTQKNIISNISFHNTIDEMLSYIRPREFDTPFKRGRMEKTPQFNSTSLLCLLHKLNKEHKNAFTFTINGPSKNESFGQIWHTDHLYSLVSSYEEKLKQDITQNEKNFIREARHTIQQYEMDEKKFGRQTLPRLGQDITNFEQPGFLGKSSMELMPKSFKKAGLLDELKKHPFLHGSGINRWQLQGSYAKESWHHNFPSAGNHSSSATEFLIALNCLSDHSLLRKEEIKILGLLNAAFMAVGGYHSFVETYPIILAAAKGEKFAVTISEKDKNLYETMYKIAKKYKIGNLEKCEKYFNCFKQEIAAIKNNFKRNKNMKSSDTLKKEQLENFYDDLKPNSPYIIEVTKIALDIINYLEEFLKNNPSGIPALLLDYDDTFVSHYFNFKHENFGNTAEQVDRRVRKTDLPIIPPMYNVYQKAVELNLEVFFVSYRKSIESHPIKEMRPYIIKNLEYHGIKIHESHIFVPNAEEAKLNSVIYKIQVRKKLTEEGYHIIANVGDQPSDIEGGYAERSFLLPNKLYGPRSLLGTAAHVTAVSLFKQPTEKVNETVQHSRIASP